MKKLVFLLLSVFQLNAIIITQCNQISNEVLNTSTTYTFTNISLC